MLGKFWNDVGDKVKLLLDSSKNKTNKWIVQNNQTVTQIAVMILKQIKKNYTKSDIDNLSKRLIQIEAFNRGIRKVTKTKTSFRTADSLFKLLYLVSQDIEEKWTVPIQNWGLILNQLMVYFEGRI